MEVTHNETGTLYVFYLFILLFWWALDLKNPVKCHYNAATRVQLPVYINGYFASRLEQSLCLLMHWGWVTHVCVSKIFIIGSDNGLSPGQCQAIIWTNAEILVIGPQGTNFNKILIKIHIFSFKIIHLKMLSGKWQPFRLGLNMLSAWRHQATTWNNHYWNGMIFTSGCLFSAKPLPKSMITMCQLVP